MRTLWIAFLALALALAAGGAAAEEKKDKPRPAAKSDKNVFQKLESSVGDWAHRNKIWIRRDKREKAKKD
ncbi:MAG TPA: hypothetical protein VF211_00230 [Burkholderiales bacterium]